MQPIQKWLLLLALITGRGYAAFDAVHFLGLCDEQVDRSDFGTQMYSAGKAMIPSMQVTCFPRHSRVNYELDETPEEQSVRFEAKIDSLIASSEGGQRIAILGASWSAWWPHYLRAGRSGVYILIPAGWPMAISFPGEPSEYEEIMNSDTITVAQVMPDQNQGGQFTGAELCRLHGKTAQRIALGLWNSDTNDPVQVGRADYAIQEFRARCPDTSIDVVQRVYTPDSSIIAAEAGFRQAFLADPGITAVIAMNDNIALGAVRAAEAVLGVRRAAEVAITGFDNNPFGQQLLAEKRMMCTVDMLTGRLGDFGFWNTISSWLDELGEGNWSTKQLRTLLGTEDTTISVPVLGLSIDPEGALFSNLLANYGTATRAVPEVTPGPTEVQVGLVGMNVREFFLAGSLQSTFWLRLTWKDTRLRWSELLYNSTLSWPARSIWTPSIIYTNIETPDAVIYESPVQISGDGTVEWELNVQGSFTCSLNTAPNPFVIHECGIRLSTPATRNEVLLAPVEMHILGGPEGFSFPEVMGYSVGESLAAPGKSRQELVYTFKTIKSTSFAIWAYVMSAALLNLMSFLQLYIPVADDRTGFGLTCVLAAMVLQTEARQSSVTTWLDVFLSISFLFQFSTFLVSVAGRRTAHSQKWTEAIVVYEHEQLKRASRLTRLIIKILGSDAVPSEDKWSRRLQLPLFSVLCMCLTFFPFGDMSVTHHPEHGVNCPLFWFGFITFLPYIFLYVVLPFQYQQVQEIYRKARVEADEEVECASPRSKGVDNTFTIQSPAAPECASPRSKGVNNTITSQSPAAPPYPVVTAV